MSREEIQQFEPLNEAEEGVENLEPIQKEAADFMAREALLAVEMTQPKEEVNPEDNTENTGEVKKESQWKKFFKAALLASNVAQFMALADEVEGAQRRGRYPTWQQHEARRMSWQMQAEVNRALILKRNEIIQYIRQNEVAIQHIEIELRNLDRKNLAPQEMAEAEQAMRDKADYHFGELRKAEKELRDFEMKAAIAQGISRIGGGILERQY